VVANNATQIIQIIDSFHDNFIRCVMITCYLSKCVKWQFRCY